MEEIIEADSFTGLMMADRVACTQQLPVLTKSTGEAKVLAKEQRKDGSLSEMRRKAGVEEGYNMLDINGVLVQVKTAVPVNYTFVCPH